MDVLELLQIYNKSGEVVTLDLIERVRAEIERLQSLAESTAHFLYWSGWLDAREAEEVKIVLRRGDEIQCGTRTFERLREALDKACPEWRTWNENYSTL